MKKYFLILCLLVVLVLPLNVYADEVTAETLDEVLTSKDIDHDFSNYEETDDQITIYLFYGKTCTYCANFLEFLNDIIDDYGQYFKVRAYEVWYNTANADLMDEVAEFLDEDASGVPFIVIGDTVYTGYSSSYDSSIKSTITALYNSDDRYDVMEELGKDTTEEASSVSSKAVIIWDLVFTAVACGAVIILDRMQMKKLNARLDEIQESLNKKKTTTK